MTAPAPGTRTDEERRAARVRAYWRQLGYDVAVRLRSDDGRGQPQYHIRSDLRDGLPRDLNPAVPVPDAVPLPEAEP